MFPEKSLLVVLMEHWSKVFILVVSSCRQKSQYQSLRTPQVISNSQTEAVVLHFIAIEIGLEVCMWHILHSLLVEKSILKWEG